MAVSLTNNNKPTREKKKNTTDGETFRRENLQVKRGEIDCSISFGILDRFREEEEESAPINGITRWDDDGAEEENRATEESP